MKTLDERYKDLNLIKTDKYIGLSFINGNHTYYSKELDCYFTHEDLSGCDDDLNYKNLCYAFNYDNHFKYHFVLSCQMLEYPKYIISSINHIKTKTNEKTNTNTLHHNSNGTRI